MKMIFILILFTFFGCSLFQETDVKHITLNVGIYFGSSTLTASPKIEWYSNDVKLYELYGSTSYYEDCRYYSYDVKYDRKAIYPDFSSKVYYYNAFGTILETDDNNFFVGLYTNKTQFTNISFP